MKSYSVLGAIFWQILVDVQNTIKIDISTHFESKNKNTIFKVINWSKSKLLTGPSWGSKKKANLDQLITLEICARNFFIFKNVQKPLFYSVFFDKQCFEKNKLGPVNKFENLQTWTS